VKLSLGIFSFTFTLFGIFEEVFFVIRIDSQLGTIEISQAYFSQLIGNAVSSCFGVAETVSPTTNRLVQFFLEKYKLVPNHGVSVIKNGDAIDVDIHLSVAHGVNIVTIVDSIVNKIRYTVNEATGLKVKKVNVYVDKMKYN
jgi:uncharacterized alkaline shock family protein YloU